MIIRTFLASLLPWGTRVILALQSLSYPALDLFFTSVTFLGSEGSYLLLLPILIWCLDKRLGVRVALLVLFSAYLNDALKALVQSPRPDPEIVRWVVSAHGWGFPSGHAQTTTALFGYLALWLRPRRWAAALWLGPPLVSLSRLYLGVHYPQDVLGGILVGLAVLAFFTWVMKKRQVSWWKRLGVWEQVGMLALITTGLSALNTSSYSVAAMGALLGMGYGTLWENRAIHFVPRASSGKQVLKLVVGLLLMALVYGMGKILLPDATGLRFLRYALLGGLATGAIPWLFLHWGWGDSPHRWTLTSERG